MVKRSVRLIISRGAIAIAAIVCSSCDPEVPSVGFLETVWVPPAEKVEVHSLGQGETVGGLLYGAVDANEQAEVLRAFQSYADPRRFRERTNVALRYQAGTNKLRSVDVAVSKDRTVRLTRVDDRWSSRLVQTPIFVDTVYATGEISETFWGSVVNNVDLVEMTFEDRNLLIDRLDNVFQWQIDFSRQIREGDSYRFVFEREVRPDGSMRDGKLLAAEFVNLDVQYHAIYFDPNGDGYGSYFDLDGESVRRAFLLKPLSYRRISGRFSSGRRHPILNTIRAHRGIDYAASIGTPVMATSDGVIIHRGPKGSFGNTVEIRHSNGWVTRYAHLNGFNGDVHLGTRVRQSDVIGYVGMTGLATGPHLHYEMLQNGRHQDPLAVDLPSGDPVPADDMTRWRAEMSGRYELLKTIPGQSPLRTFEAEAEDGRASGGSQQGEGA